jgi:hypothetical protein
MKKENKNCLILNNLSSNELFLFEQKKLHFSDGKLSGSTYFDFSHIDQNENDRILSSWNINIETKDCVQLPDRLLQIIHQSQLRKYIYVFNKLLNYFIQLYFILLEIVKNLCCIPLSFFSTSELNLINIVQPVPKSRNFLINSTYQKLLSEIGPRILLLEICK